MTEIKKPIKDIDDLDEEVKLLSVKFKSFTRKIVGLGFDYQNKISGKPSNDYFYEIRDSVSYRFQSCQYLYYLLNKHQFQDEKDLTSNPIGIEAMHSVLRMASIERPCLFDSMIYHLVSMFDYIGGLTELICGGQGRNRLKWNALVKKIKNQSGAHSKSIVSKAVLEGNHNFVDMLYEHRSTLIHDVADLGGFEYIVDDKNGKTTLHLFVTRKFLNQFAELKGLESQYRVTLRYAALYLMNKTMDLLIDILVNLREDINKNRKIPAGKEINFWKNKEGKLVDASTPYWS